MSAELVSGEPQAIAGRIEAAMRAADPYVAVATFDMINGEEWEGWVTKVGHWHAVSKRPQTIEATADTWVVAVVPFNNGSWPDPEILAIEGIEGMTFWSEEEMLAVGLYALKNPDGNHLIHLHTSIL